MNTRFISHPPRMPLLAAVMLCASVHATTTVDLTQATVSGDRLFDPARATYLPVQQDGLQLSVRPQGRHLELLTEDANGASQRIALPDEMAQLAQVRVNPRHIVAIGWINGSLASAVAVFDRSSGLLADRFWAYAPSLSPDGRHIAFAKFYPSHGIDAWEDQYRVYDLTLAPEANRPVAHATVPGAGDTADPLVDVGAVMYPVKRAELNRDFSEIPAGHAHERASAFFWSADSSLLGFVDAQAGRASLVVTAVPLPGPVSGHTRVAALPDLDNRCGLSGIRKSCTVVPTGAIRLTVGTGEVSVALQSEAASNKLMKIRLADMRPAPQ